MTWRRWWAVVGCCLLIAGIIPRAVADGAATACQLAGQMAERAQALPPGLLLAIGRVESGRRDPGTGHVVAWPWTVNAAGVGRLFDRRDQAIAETRAVQARGVASVDVGCFQINLLHHPAAFASLEQAFDPQANATYAARFLSALHIRTGSWDRAVAVYHSATPDQGGPYRDRVMASLAGADMSREDPREEIASPIRQITVWIPLQHAKPMRIWMPSAPGQAASVISIRPTLRPNALRR